MQARPIFYVFKILVLLLGLAGCGFTPVYAPGSRDAQNLSNIRVAPPPNTRVGYLFVRDLEDRLGRNPNAELLLNHSIWVFEEGVEFGVERAQVVGKVDYQLVSQSDNVVLATGSVESFTSYSSASLLYDSARRAAEERLMQILANKTITDLMVELSRP